MKRMPELDRQLNIVDLGQASLPHAHKLNFDSLSEAACAILLERYVKGWLAEPGKTVQIQLPFNRKVDFMVHDVLIEYHPINLRHEISDAQGYHRLQRIMREMKPHNREDLTEILESQFTNWYWKKRRFAIDYSEEHRGKELICCGGPTAFYKQVIKRFSEAPPRYAEFMREWQGLLSQLKG